LQKKHPVDIDIVNPNSVLQYIETSNPALRPAATAR
jgi:hypothetical protein